ncbi:hypothetical protein GUITHDRAFT_105774 [Guillardia theta CCMP2712]|uniref:Glutaredoxin domain-containing protein n=1 Tax=Guillardia theta (strain CCMP2712) TaxID=905079 RepID=L1JKF7_GUITC|nr:hypothetical protein GUITHDRAFT_105774 [Guillardia theta CCMP2712]EKX48629.1 hypothetical protein GUITHDRAFT_105774 [Guillardia theta CCMP2712]|eukprot:XP_005835609.1 hypothetical protein GUITHDRAFT_105774 [Guillardia theta CCMP2712]
MLPTIRMALKSDLGFVPSGFGLAKFDFSSRVPSMALRSSKKSGLLACQASAEDLAQKMIKSNKVMVFSKSYCPFCNKAKSTLDGLGVKYEAMELDKRADGSDIQDYMLSLTGARSVPRVFVGGKFVGGGDDVVAKAKSGELQAMLKQAGAM